MTSENWSRAAHAGLPHGKRQYAAAGRQGLSEKLTDCAELLPPILFKTLIIIDFNVLARVVHYLLCPQCSLE